MKITIDMEAEIVHVNDISFSFDFLLQFTRDHVESLAGKRFSLAWSQTAPGKGGPRIITEDDHATQS